MTITYRLDIALASAPLAASPTWTDASAYVKYEMGITVKRGGRPDEFATPQPGTLDLYLDNDGGEWTMGNPASPFYPNVVKDKRVRLTAIVGGVEYIRWDGHADDFALTYDNGTYTASIIKLTATSRWRLLARRGALRSFLSEEILLDSPQVYLPMADAAGVSTVANIADNPVDNGAVRNFGGGGTYTFGTGTGPPADGSSALVLTPASGTSGYYVNIPAPVFQFGSPFGLTLECWLNSATASNIVLNLMAGSLSVLNLYVEAAKKMQAFTDFGFLTVTSPGVVANGATRHVVLTYTADGTNHTLVLYVDGTQVATASLAGGTSFGADRLWIGGDGGNPLFTGTLSHVAFYRTALTAARVQAHYTAGWTGFGGERSDQRVARLAAYAGLSSTTAGNRAGIGIFDDAVFGLFDSTLIYAGADVSLLEQGSATVWGQNTGGQEILAALGDVATTENGVALMTRDGLLTFQTRSHRYNRPPSLAIDAGLLEQNLTWNLDDSHQVNDFTATTQDGVPQRARNQAAITGVGGSGVAITDGQTLLTRDVLDAYSNASWRVNRYGLPQSRASQIAIDLGTLDDDTAADVLPVDVGDAVTVTGMSTTWAPSASFFVEDYSEVIGIGQHLITCTTSNAGLSQVGVFGDLALGRFDSTLIFAF